MRGSYGMCCPRHDACKLNSIAEHRLTAPPPEHADCAMLAGLTTRSLGCSSSSSLTCLSWRSPRLPPSESARCAAHPSCGRLKHIRRQISPQEPELDMYSWQAKVPSAPSRHTGYTRAQELYGASRISPRSYALAPARPSTPPSTAPTSSTLYGISLPLLQRPWQTSWPGSASILQVRPTLDATLKPWPPLRV